MNLKTGVIDVRANDFPKDFCIGSVPNKQDLAELGPYLFSSETDLSYMIEQVTGIKPITTEMHIAFLDYSKLVKITWESLNKRYKELNPSIHFTAENVAFIMLLPEVLDTNFQYLVAQYILFSYYSKPSLISTIKGTARAVEAYASVLDYAKRTYDLSVTMGTALSYTKLEHVQPLIDVYTPNHFDIDAVSEYIRYLLNRKSGKDYDFIWRTLPYSHPLGDLPVLVFDGVLQSTVAMRRGYDAYLKSALAHPTSWQGYINTSLGLFK